MNRIRTCDIKHLPTTALTFFFGEKLMFKDLGVRVEQKRRMVDAGQRVKNEGSD